jgi:hypothetical protein
MALYRLFMGMYRVKGDICEVQLDGFVHMFTSMEYHSYLEQF